MSASDEPYPPAYPRAEAIVALQPFIVHRLLAVGIATRDVDDVAQQVVVATWTAVAKGLYRPDPSRDASDALKRFIFGVGIRVASHHRNRACVRREVPVGDPYGIMPEPAGPDLDAQIDARDALLALWELPHHQRELLIEATYHGAVVDLALSHGTNLHTLYTRLRAARDALAELIGRRR